MIAVWVYVARFGEGGAAGVASVRKYWELPLCWTEPVPDSSKMDPPLAKSEPVSEVGSATVVTYKKSKKHYTTAAGRKE